MITEEIKDLKADLKRAQDKYKEIIKDINKALWKPTKKLTNSQIAKAVSMMYKGNTLYNYGFNCDTPLQCIDWSKSHPRPDLPYPKFSVNYESDTDHYGNIPATIILPISSVSIDLFDDYDLEKIWRSAVKNDGVTIGLTSYIESLSKLKGKVLLNKTETTFYEVNIKEFKIKNWLVIPPQKY